MTQELHERARGLMDTARVEGISATDQAWLDAHLDSCAECAQFAAATEGALRTLRQVSVQVDPALVARTRRIVHLRASELNSRQSQWLPLWMSCALSWILGGLTLPWVWQGIQWAGRYVNLPGPVNILFLLVWWALPTLVVAALVASGSSKAVRDRQD